MYKIFVYRHGRNKEGPIPELADPENPRYFPADELEKMGWKIVSVYKEDFYLWALCVRFGEQEV